VCPTRSEKGVVIRRRWRIPAQCDESKPYAAGSSARCQDKKDLVEAGGWQSAASGEILQVADSATLDLIDDVPRRNPRGGR